MSPSVRPARLALCAALALGAAAVPATSAQALGVSSGPDGLQMSEPNNTLNRIDLSIIEGGARYRVEMSEFGGRGLGAGSNCQMQPQPRQGVDVVHCDRIVPKVSVNMGPLGDSFKVDPSFPDPIDIFGDLGDDFIQLGAGNDTARAGSGAGSIRGNGGDDTIEGGSDFGSAVFGGDGNDRLTARDGNLDGEAGDDVLTVASRASTIRGGDGTDTFEANGRAGKVDSRDGIAEQIVCGVDPSASARIQLRGSALAFVDLVDTPNDAGLFDDGCRAVDRAPKNEETSVALRSTALKLKKGAVALKVRCKTSGRCSGKAVVQIGSKRSKAVSYKVRGRRTSAVRVPVKRSAQRATVVLSERGHAGSRTVRTVVAVER